MADSSLLTDPTTVGFDQTCESLPILNLTDPTVAEPYLLDSLESQVVLIAMFLICAVGLPGNLLFLVSVFKLHHMRNATNIYLTNLAFVDLMFLLISVGLYLSYFLNPVRTHLTSARAVGCIGSFVMSYITYFVSVCTVTLVTSDKYCALCYPMRYIRRQNKTLAVRLVLLSWLVGAVLTGCAMLRYARLTQFCAVWPDSDRYKDFPLVLGYCVAISPTGLIIAHSVESVVFVVALLANFFMYAKIIAKLSVRATRKRSQASLQPAAGIQQATQARNQLARLLIINGTVFFLCQGPFIAVSMATLVNFLRGINPAITYQKIVLFVTISHVFILLNSAVNPVIYTASSRLYRQAFKRTLRCRTMEDKTFSTTTKSYVPTRRGTENHGLGSI